MSTEAFTLFKAKEVLKRYEMLKPGDKIVAAVSGGCDSSVLLHLLCALSTEMDLQITCAHINHNLRGEESKRDEAFVKDLCSKYGVPCKVLSADVAAFAKKQHLSTEEAGRKLRYEFFEHCAAELGEDAKIATAHSLSDCAETFIFNSARGAALGGICGIPPKRGRIIRPLIEFSREEIEAYAAEHKIDYVTDSTNLTDEYTRNKIRHSVIPVMKEINPGFEKTFLRLMKSLNETKDFVEDEAAKLLSTAKTAEGYNGEILSTAPAAVKNRAAAMLLEAFGFSFDFERTLRIANRFGGKDFKEELSKNSYLVQRGGIIKKEQKPRAQNEIPEREFETGKILLFEGKTAEIQVFSKEKLENSYKIKELALKDTFDFDKIVGKAVLRSRKTGDKADIHGGTKTLKKLFIEEKIPAEKRGEVLLVADEAGVLWVEGLGAAKRARLSEKTVNAAVIKTACENKTI